MATNFSLARQGRFLQNNTCEDHALQFPEHCRNKNRSCGNQNLHSAVTYSTGNFLGLWRQNILGKWEFLTGVVTRNDMIGLQRGMAVLWNDMIGLKRGMAVPWNDMIGPEDGVLFLYSSLTGSFGL